jgi:hypothetical protein
MKNVVPEEVEKEIFQRKLRKRRRNRARSRMSSNTERTLFTSAGFIVGAGPQAAST